MDLSVFHEIQTIDVSAAGVQRAYDETIEQMILADEPRYRTASFVEHHFLPGYCFCPAPELVLTYIASKTKRIRLGHGIVQLPFGITQPRPCPEERGANGTGGWQCLVAGAGDSNRRSSLGFSALEKGTKSSRLRPEFASRSLGE
jgi:hypothetical protein